MISKKNLLLVLLASFALTLGACNNGKKPSSSETGSGSSETVTESTEQPSETDTTEEETTEESTEPETSESTTEEAPTVSSIEVKEGTVKTDYYVGDEFTVAGGKLVVKYSDHSREEIDMTLAMVKNAPDMSVAHENYEVQVEYEGTSTSYVINVVQADTREEVSIGISYDYNGSEAVELDLTKPVELKFTVDKSYHFYYGCYPGAARESLGYKYVKLGEQDEDLGTEKPYGLGNYTYSVYLADGDENYKPVSVTINFSIVEPVTKAFVLNKDNAPELGAAAGELTQTVDGVSVKYKNAKAAEDAVATLVKQADAEAIAPVDDNYIEIASPLLVTDALTVNFTNQENQYVSVYGSYDGENFVLLDTLTRSRQTTNKANHYFYFRLVASPIGSQEVTISNISFTYEVDGAPVDAVAKAEYSDLINHLDQVEEGAYYSEKEVVSDSTTSNKSIKMRNFEVAAKLHFETSFYFTRYWKFSFKAKLSEGATFQSKEDGQWVTKENVSFYVRAFNGSTKVGPNYKVKTLTNETDWVTCEFYLGDIMGDDVIDMTDFRFWINRKVDGFVYVDDFRVEQRVAYPVANSPWFVSVVENSVQKTDFTVGEQFSFGGQLSVKYTDGSEAVVDESDPNLSVVAPDMTSSGEKTVTVKYTYGGITMQTTYRITVTSSGNPKDEEILPIVDEADDLAKAANQTSSGSSYDKGKITDESEITYGNSTNSIKISGLYSANVNAGDTGMHASIHTPSVIVKETVHVQFFAKGLTYKLDLELMDDTTPKAKSVAKAAFASLTATDAGNGWTLYEYDFTTSNKNVYLLKFKCAEKSGDHSDFFYVDGLVIA